MHDLPITVYGSLVTLSHPTHIHPAHDNVYPVSPITTYGLQEILRPPPRSHWNSALVIRHGAEDGEAWVQVFAEIHDGGDVAAAVAVVGSGPDCYDGFVVKVPL